MTSFNHLCTAVLVGLIWVIQLVHYPSFHYVEKSRFRSFESFHASRITLIVLPLMLLELSSSAYLLTFKQGKINSLNFLLVAIIWATTIFVSMPCHKKLSDGYQKNIVDKLIKTNWIRTLCWSFKFFLGSFHLIK